MAAIAHAVNPMAKIHVHWRGAVRRARATEQSLTNLEKELASSDKLKYNDNFCLGCEDLVNLNHIGVLDSLQCGERKCLFGSKSM